MSTNTDRCSSSSDSFGAAIMQSNGTGPMRKMSSKEEAISEAKRLALAGAGSWIVFTPALLVKPNVEVQKLG